MLLGVSALAAWGLHRFQVLTANLPFPLGIGVSDAEHQKQIDAFERGIFAAYQSEFRSIFLITAGICVVGAAFALVAGRPTPADHELMVILGGVSGH